MDTISMETAIAITERSRSTWWRRISQREVARVADDASGRAMLSWIDVVPLICIPMDDTDLSYVLRADVGDAEAQNDIAQLFLIAGKHKTALYWFQQAANQDYPDAMQWLGICYLHGNGVIKNDNLGLMWIAKAAAHGHVIAQEQMKALSIPTPHAGQTFWKNGC